MNCDTLVVAVHLCFLASLFMALDVEAFVTLASSQLAIQVEFYRAFLKQEPSVHSDRYAEFRLSGLRLAIFVPKAENVSVFTAQTSGAMSICLEVEHLEQAITRLSSMGYPPADKIISASHGREIYAYDPDGNRLILHQAH